MVHGYQTLTDKEKQTLRLLVEGYDAKTMARHLGLSVHTVNERLRDARRKMAVSSSREAARQLRAAERTDPDLLGDETLGGAVPCPDLALDKAPAAQTIPFRHPAFVIGGIAMSLSLAILAYAAVTGEAATADAAQAPATATVAAEGPATAPALQWLVRVDGFDWTGSYQATSQQFQSLNTLAVWADASEQARRPLGTVVSRRFVSEEWVPATPNGERLVRFRTSFANHSQALETIPLVLEDGAWKVVGYIID